MNAALPQTAPFLAIGLRLSAALVAGAILGYEREFNDHAAGLRTHILVSIGSAFFILIPIQMGLATTSPGDLSRVIQGIITGVGFVGAGSIFYQKKGNRGKKEAHGLTTAAGIWVAAGLGIAAGCGFWGLLAMGLFYSWLTLSLLKRLEKRLLARQQREERMKGEEGSP